MKFLWVIIVFLLALIYIRYYTTPSRYPELVQTTLALCTPELLSEKNPILLTDRVVNHADLLGTVFKYQYARSSVPAPLRGGANKMKTDARFTLIYTTMASNVVVDIELPNTHHQMRVLLRVHETLVVPPRWTIRPAADVTVIKLYDMFHVLSRCAGR